MNYYSKLTYMYADILNDYGITQSIVNDYADGNMFNLLYEYDLWDEFGDSQSYENFYDYIQECTFNTLEMTDKEVFESLEEVSYKLNFKDFLNGIKTYGLGIDFGIQSFAELVELISLDKNALNTLRRLFEKRYYICIWSIF